MPTPTPALRRTSRAWPGIAPTLAILFLGLAFAGVVLAALLDQTPVRDRGDQAGVAFGMPFAWLVQDQSAADPPYPSTAGVLSPWEHSTTVDVLPLLADLAIAGAPVAAAYLTYLAVRRRPE